MSLGEQIRTLRKRQGLTQEQLGELIGAHINSVVRWENESRVPNATMLRKLAEALGTNADILLHDGQEVTVIERPVMPSARKKEPPRLTYWAEVVEEARSVVKRGDREELIDVRALLERALSAVEDGCLMAGIEVKRSPVVVGGAQPQGEHENAV